MNVKLAELISQNGGKLPFYLTKDSYPVYYITIQGMTLCPKCANLIIKGEKTSPFGKRVIADDLVDYRINWDNYYLTCELGHKIESATLDLTKIEFKTPNTSHIRRHIPSKISHS